MNLRLASLTLLGLVLLGAGLGAQESASSGISGQVVDSTKGAMPGATVTVTNAGTNAQRVVVTDAEGRFTIPNLPPATYSIRVELSGFQTAEIRDLTLRNGEIARPTVALGLASISENVTVVGMSPLLQTTNASVSQTISQKQIEDLPVAGRSLLSFVGYRRVQAHRLTRWALHRQALQPFLTPSLDSRAFLTHIRAAPATRRVRSGPL